MESSEIRYKVLNAALTLEELFSILLKKRFDITKKSLHTLGNKSSNISFKNKIDFLYDLEIIEKEEYNDLVLFAEIRNQFIHNYNCTCFTYLFTETTVKNRKPHFLKVNPKKSDKETEEYYSETFDLLLEKLRKKIITITVKVEKYSNHNNLESISALYNTFNLMVYKNILLYVCNKYKLSVKEAEELALAINHIVEEESKNLNTDNLGLDKETLYQVRDLMKNFDT